MIDTTPYHVFMLSAFGLFRFILPRRALLNQPKFFYQPNSGNTLHNILVLGMQEKKLNASTVSSEQSAGPCLDLIFKFPKVSHRILRHLHGELNIDKIKKLIA